MQGRERGSYLWHDWIQRGKEKVLKIYTQYPNLISKVSANDEQANEQTNNPQGFDGGLSVMF